MTERFFIPKPAPVPASPVPGRMGRPDLTVYRTPDDGRDLLWSNTRMPLPEVGQRVFITMNRIGWAVVVGYFEAEGYLGVMTRATNPPLWLRRQRREDQKSGRKMPQWMLDGIGCEYGTEIAPKRPKPQPVAQEVARG